MSLPPELASRHQLGALEDAQVLQHCRAVEVGKPGAELARRARGLLDHRRRRGRLEAGGEVTWDFHDFPGAFPVTVVEADPPRRIVIEWEGEATTGDQGTTTTTFEFEPIDDGARTLVTITESSWQVTPDGAKHAFGNCEGWTGMLAAMKAWVEHGINLRDGFYA